MSKPFQLVALGDLANLRIGGTPSRAEPSFWAHGKSGYLWASIADLRGKYLDSTAETITSSGARSARLQKVPVSVPIMSFKLTLGKVTIPQYPVYTNEAVVALFPKAGRANASWLYYAVPHIVSRTVTETAVKGQTLNLAKLKRLRIPTPGNFAEQQQIAEILDAADSSIESAELELVKRRKLADAMICALLDTVDRSNMVSVGYHYSIASGLTLGPYRQVLTRTAPYLRVANVQRGRIDLTDVTITGIQEAERHRYSLQTGDLLVVEGHADPDQIGRCAQVDDAACRFLYQNHLFRLRSRAIAPEFGLEWLNSGTARAYWRMRCATSSGLYTINGSLLAQMPMPLVTGETQGQVVSLVRASNVALKAAAEMLGKLRMVKKGLMDDLLTGRVRVSELSDIPGTAQ